MEWNRRGGTGEQFWDLGYIWCQSWHNLPDDLLWRSVALILLLEIYSKVIIMDLHKDTIIRTFMIGNGKMLEIAYTSQTSDLVKKNYEKSWNDTNQKLADILSWIVRFFSHYFSFMFVCIFKCLKWDCFILYNNKKTPQSHVSKVNLSLFDCTSAQQGPMIFHLKCIPRTQFSWTSSEDFTNTHDRFTM